MKIDALKDITKDKRIEYAEDILSDVLLFARDFLPHVLTHEVPEFHEELYAILPCKKRLLIAAPRGFAKSKITSVIYPIWLAVSGILYREILIISASETLAKDMLRQIKAEIESNQMINQLFGDLVTDKWSENHIVTKSGVSIRARGAEAQIRGFRPDCIILDDIETDESVLSEEQRKKVKDWILKACLPALTPDGQCVMVGSIIHFLAILNEMMDSDNGWEKRKYQAYKNGIKEPGHELWASLWPHEKLKEREKEIGSWAFAAEYMNDPIAEGAVAIKPNEIRYWETLPSQLSCVIAVDPAYSEDQTADYKVASLVGIDQQNNRYLCRYVRTRDSIGDFYDSVLNLWLQNKGMVSGIGVPNSGTEKSFFQGFLKRAEERRLYPPIVELKNTFITAQGNSVRSKKSRIIAALQPLFQRGHYFIHKTMEEARGEILQIGSSRWDDIVDSMAYAEQILTPMFSMENPEFKESYEYSNNRREVVANYGY